ncbi:MAG: tetratricopeptide repeat protein [Deltaproteobacteria bacterium]|nr:tetratricopeptide repeat protein [Deltaproteobacteria bacterium]
MRLLAILLLVTSTTLSASALAAPTAEQIADRLAQGNHALLDWQLDEAAAIALELDSDLPDVPPVQALLGAVKFHQGDYDGAVALLRRSAEAGGEVGLLPLAESTLKETRGFVSVESKHFVVRVPAGKDELLLPIATWALEDAFTRITAAFDYVPQHKIAVDVLHDAKGLASVSTLTEKEIETSGTIALCKFNRLMITSPKALARGYSWLDTLSHEFLHLIISEKSKNTVPVWLHEGLAKYNETRWRGPPGLALDPASENLLAKGVKNNKLITFEQMHPSMAKLPSQEDTALAFSEVFSVIEFIELTIPEKGGKRATNILLEGLRDDLSMDAALQKATGRDLAGLQRDWRAYLKKRPFKLVPGAEPQTLTFVKNARGAGASADEEEDEAALREGAKKGAEGRRFVRLGNLLRERRRLKAAAVEYERATAITGVTSPALHNRLAGVWLETGELQKAKDVLQKTVNVFPDDPQTRVLLGRIALRAEEWTEARTQYERATWENPFIPEVHVALLAVADKTGDKPLAERSTSALKLLAGHQKKHPDASFLAGADDDAGLLSVRTEPWGKLFVDGVDTNRITPLIELRLKPGKHFVRIEDPIGGRADGVVVDVVAGVPISLQLTLRSLTEDQRRSLFAAEAAVLPRPEKPVAPAIAHDGADDVVPPWIEEGLDPLPVDPEEAARRQEALDRVFGGDLPR